LIDPRKKATTKVDGQINIAAVYREAGTAKSSLNADGTSKEAKPKYGAYTAGPAAKHDLTKQQEAGAAGSLEVYPKSFECASEQFTGVEIRARFTLPKGAPATTDVGKVAGNSIKWMDMRTLAVTNTLTDTDLLVELVKVTAKGQADEVIATGTLESVSLV
jgi:hypothetical protein